MLGFKEIERPFQQIILEEGSAFLEIVFVV